jgi:L-iditol 2-dehydrogenase
MKAAVVHGPDQLAIEDLPAPEPGSDALVRVHQAGICITDLKVLHASVPARQPVVLGHELMGRVEIAAPGSAIPAGARVVIDPSSACGYCPVCLRDLPHLCPGGGLMGRDLDGGFAELVPVPGHRLHALPDEISDADAVLLQMLSTCVHAQSRLAPQLGQSGLIVGLGAAGLLQVQLLAARGVAPLIGISESAAQRALGERLGATVTGTPAEAAAVVHDATGGLGADIGIECTGSRDALVQVMEAAALGGTVLIQATIPGSADQLPVYDWYLKELTILNTRAARPRDFTAAIRAVADGLVQPGQLISSSYPLAKLADALAAAARPQETKVTITVTPPGW